MKYLVCILTSLLLITTVAPAQTISDALRYSDFNLSGTARSMGVGNSLGAFGADFTVLSSNPAGLAQFRSSRFILTPSLSINEADSRLQATGNDFLKETKTNFNFANLGLVLASRPNSSKWKTSNLGIGFNRLANFHRKFYYRGVAKGSIVDRWVLEANEADGFLNDFETGPASDVFAIYTDGVSPDITSDFELKPDADIEIEQEYRSSGSMNELVFAYAGNYRDKLMLGFSVGIPFVSFDETKVYRETDIDSIPFFNALEFEENLTTTGVGVNLKVGAIYRFNQMFRVGVAVHTPTAYSFNDNFNTSLTYDYTDADNDGPITANSPDGNFEYKFRSPWRLMANVGVLIPKKGFLSAEVEWIDYTANSFNLTANSSSQADRDYEEELNSRIDQRFNSALNLRLGGEYALEKLRFRAGYNLKLSPMDEEANYNTNAFSLGLGLQEQQFSIDIAYQRSNTKAEFIPYEYDGGPGQIINNEFVSNQVLLTVGFRF